MSPNFQGILVDSIVRGGPVDTADLHGSTTDQYGKKHGGDVITGVDGLQVKRIEDLISYVEQHKSAGDKITLNVYRNGQTLSLQATLQQRPFPHISIL